jgi:hypothetical protein
MRGRPAGDGFGIKANKKLSDKSSTAINQRNKMSHQTAQGMSLLTSIFALTGFILNWFAVGTCDFVHLALTYGSSAAPDAISLHFGIWSYQAWTVVTSLGGSVVFQGCWRYPEYIEFGESMQWSRAASSIALIITLGFAFVDFLSVCTVTGRRITSPFVQCIGYMTASIFMGLSLLILNSDVCNSNDLSDQFQALFPNVAFDQASCTIARGAKCAISATVFYFLAGASSCVASRVEKSDAKKGGTGLEEPLFQE